MVDRIPAPEQMLAANPKRLGAALRAMRDDQGLTQAEAADLAGVSRKWVSEVEQGKPTAEMGKVLQVVHALGFEIMCVRAPKPDFDLSAYVASFALPPESDDADAT